MRGVTQTILHNDPEGRTGNCLQAALATLVGVPLERVPHFAEHEDWAERMVAWVDLAAGCAVRWKVVGTYVARGIGVGMSPRGVKHAVVVVDGEIVWDPHPSRAGLDVLHGYMALIPWDELGDDE